MPMGSQYNCGYILGDSSELDDLQGLGLENIHIILESDKEHYRGSKDEIEDLHDAVQMIMAGLGFCQDLIEEKVLLKPTFHAQALKQWLS